MPRAADVRPTSHPPELACRPAHPPDPPPSPTSHPSGAPGFPKGGPFGKSGAKRTSSAVESGDGVAHQDRFYPPVRCVFAAIFKTIVAKNAACRWARATWSRGVFVLLITPAGCFCFVKSQRRAVLVLIITPARCFFSLFVNHTGTLFLLMAT